MNNKYLYPYTGKNHATTSRQKIYLKEEDS